MRTQMRTALMTVGFTVLMGGMVLLGQMRRSETAQIPFAFQVGGKMLPAGTYSATLTDAGGIVQLEDRATLKSVIVTAFIPLAGKASNSSLGFRCYNGVCFLSQISFAGEANSHGLVVTRRERELAENTRAPKLVYVASR